MLLFLLPALAGPEAFPEMEACLEAGNHTQLAINLCSGRRARAHQALLELHEARVGWTGDEAAFTEASAAFDAFRKARCHYLGSFWEGGSGQPMIINGCGSQTRAERIERLAQLLQAKAPEVRPLAEADAELNATWKAKAKGDAGMLDVQRAWLTYRDAQCAWEETRQAGSKDACLAWLTEQRTKQIVSDVQR